jgi:HlyD family secretion protein
VRIYLLRDQAPQPVEVRLGITDGSQTEVLEGKIEEGSEVIIGMSDSAKTDNPSGVVNPFQPARVRGR